MTIKNRGRDKDTRPKLILGNDRGGTWHELKQKKKKKSRQQDKINVIVQNYLIQSEVQLISPQLY